MQYSTLLRQRLIALFLAAVLLLFSPLALQFEALGSWLGIPVLFIYIFTVWAGVIAATAWIIGRGSD